LAASDALAWLAWLALAFGCGVAVDTSGDLDFEQPAAAVTRRARKIVRCVRIWRFIL